MELRMAWVSRKKGSGSWESGEVGWMKARQAASSSGEGGRE